MLNMPESRDPLEPPRLPDRQPDLEAQVAQLAAAVSDLRVAQAEQELPTTHRLRPLETILVVLLAFSLLLHALTVSQLLRVRGTLRNEIAQLAERVSAAKTSQVRYDLPIDQQLPINIDVPIKRSLNVPINTEVRIKQDITLPVDTVLGKFDLPIPIDATIPISTTVPIAFDQTIAISTTVPIKLNVPVQVDLGSDQLAPVLDQLRQKLLELRDSL